MSSSFPEYNTPGRITAIPYHYFLPELHQIGSITPMLRDFSQFTGWHLDYHAATEGKTHGSEAENDKKTEIAGKIFVGPIPPEASLPHPLPAEIVQELTETEDVWIPVHVSLMHSPVPEEVEVLHKIHAAEAATKEFSAEEAQQFLEFMEEEAGKDAVYQSLVEKRIPLLDHNAPTGFLHLHKPEKLKNAPTKNLKTPTQNSHSPHLSFENARKLANTVADMLAEWLSTRLHLWKLEAEMVRCSPVFNRPASTDENHFSARFRLLLEYTRQMLGVDAIGVYLMDGWGTHLKLRGAAGLSMDRLQKPARRWKQMVPDTMAMQGDIVFYDGNEVHDWLPPEGDFAAGICLPLVTGHSLFGTVWFYSDTPHFFDSERSILETELFADHFALDLEREAAYLKQLMAEAYEDEMRETARFQKNQLPIPACWTDVWDFAGWVNAPRTVRGFCEIPNPTEICRSKKLREKRDLPAKSVSGDFYDWFSVPGNPDKIVFAQGSVGIRGLAGACIATAVKTALRAHATYDHSADELLRIVNHTLWMQSAADGKISLCCGVIEKKGEQQVVRFSAVGTIDAYHFHKEDGCQVLNPPLAETEHDYLGAMSYLNCTEEVLALESGDFLLMISDGISYGLSPLRREARKQALEKLLHCRRKHGAGLITAFARNYILNRHELPPGKDHSVLVIKKK